MPGGGFWIGGSAARRGAGRRPRAARPSATAPPTTINRTTSDPPRLELVLRRGPRRSEPGEPALLDRLRVEVAVARLARLVADAPDQGRDARRADLRGVTGGRDVE